MKIPVIPPLTLDKFNSIGERYPIFPDEIDCIELDPKGDFTAEKKLEHKEGKNDGC